MRNACDHKEKCLAFSLDLPSGGSSHQLLSTAQFGLRKPKCPVKRLTSFWRNSLVSSKSKTHLTLLALDLDKSKAYNFLPSWHFCSPLFLSGTPFNQRIHPSNYHRHPRDLCSYSHKWCLSCGNLSLSRSDACPPPSIPSSTRACLFLSVCMPSNLWRAPLSHFLLYPYYLDVIGTQLNCSAIFDGLMYNWHSLFGADWLNFCNLPIILYHDLAGDSINNTTVADTHSYFCPWSAVLLLHAATRTSCLFVFHAPLTTGDWSLSQTQGLQCCALGSISSSPNQQVILPMAITLQII